MIYRFYILVAIVLCACSDPKPTINFRAQELSMDDYDMIYEAGNWEHPAYKDPFVSHGNHRVIIEVPENEPYVLVNIPWRRRDANPANKAIVIVDAKSNEVVNNRFVLGTYNEFGALFFAPNPGSSIYHIYYYPHQSTGSYYPKLQYIKPDEKADLAWLSKTGLPKEEVLALPKAKILKAQSLDQFHSFFPMEIIATETETDQFKSLDNRPFYLFPEYRERPIKMQDYLPQHWVKDTVKVNGLKDTASKGEYFTYQVGVYAVEDLKRLTINLDDFKGESGTIGRNQLTSFNTEGIDLNGIPLTKTIDVRKGKIQALWFGVDISEDTPAGRYLGSVRIQPEGLRPDTVYIELNITSNLIANRGDDSPENMSRLRWLNSTIGRSKETIIKPFEPVSISDKTLKILGREIKLGSTGLPDIISSYFTQEMTRLKTEKEEVLAQPMTFKVISEGNQSEKWESSIYEVSQDYDSEAKWQAQSSSDNFRMIVNGTLEYDGMLDYKIKLVANQSIQVENIQLQIPMAKDASEYILGLGYKGGFRGEDIHWKWDIKKHQEGAWIGTVNKGLQYVLRDENYERPLNTNFYQNKPLNLPPSWYNEGKGGIDITDNNGTVQVSNYSGPRQIKKGDTLHFNIRFLITPFKLLDTKTHFSTRFVHKYVPVDSVVAWNGTIVNVHHANEVNPYINYPFHNIELQKAYIDEAHHKGVKVKLYNTIRELSYKAYELFAFKSLGTEILNDGEGGGHSWLQEHFKSNYHSAWHATRVNDAAILNKGNSRWTNYYIEGINWLAQNQGMDGLYLDDIAFSRPTVKRIANVLSEHRENYVIDLHSANQYNPRDGFTNSAFLYMEHFPYVSRLWFGEYFEYDLDPDYWMVEVSGIPYGLYGEMLEKGGHPYRGLVYGMTTRVYGIYDPRAIWELFEEFNIANSEMLGYWVDRSPIKTDHPGIKSTVYLHPDKVMIALGSWSARDEDVSLNIDWEALGMNGTKARIYAPEVEGLQKQRAYGSNKPVEVKANKGLILIIEEN